MTALAAAGRRSEALARYERLKDDLLEDFGTDPDAQTTELFARLLAGSGPSVAPIVRGNRPTPLTSFVAREREVQEITGLLTRRRLTTLTGAGGCGKTRLAIEVAGAVGDRHPHGVWFVDLAVLIRATAAAQRGRDGARPDTRFGCGCHASPGRPAPGAHGAGRARQLRAPAGRGDPAGGCCPGVCPELTVLVTSREPLRVPGEVTFRVPSLEVPARLPHAWQPVDLADVPSVELFVERARQAAPTSG